MHIAIDGSLVCHNDYITESCVCSSGLGVEWSEVERSEVYTEWMTFERIYNERCNHIIGMNCRELLLHSDSTLWLWKPSAESTCGKPKPKEHYGRISNR